MSTNDTSALVEAQNRTTRAVRAIAVYILYSALFSLIGGVVLGFTYIASLSSGLSSTYGGYVFGILIVVAGGLFALFKGLSELGKSAILPEVSVLADAAEHI